jgi:VRR-NUC domain
MSPCSHIETRCLNQYEFIRKYRCVACEAVMMCACDEARGRRFLPHQLNQGVELETQARVRVTVGFRPGVCRECRGVPVQPHPMASGWGRTSKIKRYYWRELWFREQEIFAEMMERIGASNEDDANPAAAEVSNEAGARALREIKELHRTAPKYVFSGESQDDVIRRYGVQVVVVNATYLASATPRALVSWEGGAESVEDWARHHFEEQEYSVLTLESRPFHVLFGVYMWLLIQDIADPKNMLVGFGGRGDIAQRNSPQIWMQRPQDFGTAGYGRRRADAIEEHLSSLDELEWLFDYWLGPSEPLRQYLWAGQPADIEVARKLVGILPASTIVAILRYLIQHYWGRYLGWPDLLLYRGSEIRCVEVKSSSDKLSEDQKRWIADNHEILKLPFSILKIHRKPGDPG